MEPGSEFHSSGAVYEKALPPMGLNVFTLHEEGQELVHKHPELVVLDQV